MGKGTEALFRPDMAPRIYDKDSNLCKGANCLDDVTNCSLLFVCVPTPMRADGTCHTDIVEEVVNELKAKGVEPWRIIIRSTVPPGTSEALGVNFMPEFLTERNWKKDAQNCTDLVLGTDNSSGELLQTLRIAIPFTVRVHLYPTREAELIKYARNAFLATKVSFFNEIAEFCEAAGINYDDVRSGTVLDDRIGESHTAVPGPDGMKGFGGTCLPKDTNALYHQMFDQGLNPCVLEGVLRRNQDIDRPEEDWKDDHGRAVI